MISRPLNHDSQLFILKNDPSERTNPMPPPPRCRRRAPITWSVTRFSLTHISHMSSSLDWSCTEQSEIVSSTFYAFIMRVIFIVVYLRFLLSVSQKYVDSDTCVTSGRISHWNFAHAMIVMLLSPFARDVLDGGIIRIVGFDLKHLLFFIQSDQPPNGSNSGITAGVAESALLHT